MTKLIFIFSYVKKILFIWDQIYYIMKNQRFWLLILINFYYFLKNYFIVTTLIGLGSCILGTNDLLTKTFYIAHLDCNYLCRFCFICFYFYNSVYNFKYPWWNIFNAYISYGNEVL